MSLLAPEVKGPISICNKQVRIKGHIAGATVKVLVNGSETAAKVSNWPDDVLDIGVSLNVGDKITAIQEFGGQTSPESPLPAVAQDVPSTLANLSIATLLHRCGTAIWTEGAVPGAEIRALIGNNQVGSGFSVDGITRFRYQPGLNLGQKLTLEQTTCTNVTQTTVTPPADDLPNPLPVPKIQEPLIDCMTAIKISNIVDGATVTIYRNGTKDVSGAFDRSSLTWIGLKPLKESEFIEVDQSFACRGRVRGRNQDKDSQPTHISGKAGAKVQSVHNLPKPVIKKPVCPNATLITVTNLLPGARVLLYQKEQMIGMTDTPESTFSFNVPKLDPDAELTARMQLCAKVTISDSVKPSADKPLQDLDVSRPYECAAYVAIQNYMGAGAGLKNGKIVYVKNKQGDLISSYHQVFHHSFLIPVSPALSVGEEVTVMVRNCGGAEQSFGPHKVEPLPRRLPAPEIYEPVTENSSGVGVLSGYAGALVKVYVDGQYRGHSISNGVQGIIYTPVSLTLPPLQLGQQVTATQSLCGKLSPVSKPVTVVNPLPHKPQLIEPVNNASGIDPKPITFKWKDPGANTSAAATNFQLNVYKGNTSVHSYDGSGNQHSPNLDFDTGYSWKVVAVNSTGQATSSNYTFQTKPEPAPPPQKNALVGFGSSLYASYDGITQVWPIPANTAFYLCIVVANAGNATSDPFDVVFAWQGNSQSGTYTVNVPAAAPGWSDIAFKTFQSGLPEGHYMFEVAVVLNNNIVDYTFWNAWVGF